MKKINNKKREKERKKITNNRQMQNIMLQTIKNKSKRNMYEENLVTYLVEVKKQKEKEEKKEN